MSQLAAALLIVAALALPTSITPLAADWGTRTIDTAKHVAANTTIEARVQLAFVAGGHFEIAGGATLTIEGTLVGAPAQQLFSGDGLVRFGPGSVEHVLPQ